MNCKLITAQNQDSESISYALWVSYQQKKCQSKNQIILIGIKLLTSVLLEIFGSLSQFSKGGANGCFAPLLGTPMLFQS